MTESSNDVTCLLERIRGGDSRAASDLLPLVYDELRKLAESRMRHEAAGVTLQPTALVHEAYLRLVGDVDPGWDGRGHFFAAAARAMERILVDQARARARLKRGGDRRRELLPDVADTFPGAPPEEIIALHEALNELEADDPRKARIVRLRYFAGLTAEEAAGAIGVSLSTLEREWRFVKAWLYEKLHGGEGRTNS